MQVVIGEHALYAPDADRPPGLDELLRDHLRGRLGIEKPVADDLPHDFVRPTAIPLRATFLALQRGGAAFAVRGAELKVTLPAVAVLP